MNKWPYNNGNTHSLSDILTMFNASKADIELWVKYYEFPKAVHRFNNKVLYPKAEVSKWAEAHMFLWKKKAKFKNH